MASVLELAPTAVTARRGAYRRLLRQRRFQIGGTLLIVLLALIFFGPVIAPYGYKQLGLGVPGASPSRSHLLGIDSIGRDVWSRLLYGGRRILIESAAADALAFLLALTFGLAAARRGGWIAVAVTRAVDIALAIPPLLLIFLLVSVYGDNVYLVVLVTVLTILPGATRLVRGLADSALHADYVLAAEARGESTWYLMTGEILPNIARPLLALTALGLSGALATVASISFLGIGAPPPTPDWGRMVAENSSVILSNPWAVLSPAIAMSAVVLAVTLMADAMADVLAGADPGRG
ncbi:MAG: binding-protein-dependent transport system inner rane component [Pseudonocardiales bacterium]|nr:binding-protein-dependent transport system inner rane component [Pseudonocardiales bacterium]